MMDIFDEFNSIIKRNISAGKKKFVICMFGRNGMFLKDLLNYRYGIEEELIIDNELCQYNNQIIGLPDVRDLKEKSDLQFIITSDVESFVYELKNYVNAGQIYSPFLARNKNIRNVNIGKYSYGPLVDAVKAGQPEVEKIGSFCSFAFGVCAVWNHPTNLVTTHEFTYCDTHCKELGGQSMLTWNRVNKQCVIENDVWLGQNVIIANGAHIGNGVIAGAGSVITKDIPDYAVVVGSPARIIRYRFNSEQIRKLNEIRWWDWPDEKIRECQKDFLDINIFLNKHYKKKS